MSEIVDPNLRAALLAEGEELFKKRSRLEARLAALDNLHDCLIEVLRWMKSINSEPGIERVYHPLIPVHACNCVITR